MICRDCKPKNCLHSDWGHDRPLCDPLRRLVFAASRWFCFSENGSETFQQASTPFSWPILLIPFPKYRPYNPNSENVHKLKKGSVLTIAAVSWPMFSKILVWISMDSVLRGKEYKTLLLQTEDRYSENLRAFSVFHFKSLSCGRNSFSHLSADFHFLFGIYNDVVPCLSVFEFWQNFGNFFRPQLRLRSLVANSSINSLFNSNQRRRIDSNFLWCHLVWLTDPRGTYLWGCWMSGVEPSYFLVIRTTSVN